MVQVDRFSLFFQLLLMFWRVTSATAGYVTTYEGVSRVGDITYLSVPFALQFALSFVLSFLHCHNLSCTILPIRWLLIITAVHVGRTFGRNGILGLVRAARPPHLTSTCLALRFSRFDLNIVRLVQHVTSGLFLSLFCLLFSQVFLALAQQPLLLSKGQITINEMFDLGSLCTQHVTDGGQVTYKLIVFVL